MVLVDRITADQLEIVVHHVGGIGDFGPCATLGSLGHVHWVVYDAVEGALTTLTHPNGGRVSLVNRCVGATDSDETFYVTAAPSASSLLRTATSARDYTLMYANGSALRWGAHTQVSEKLSVYVHSLDGLVENGDVPGIDFLSVDAQGAELHILNGASRSIGARTIGVICEVEFSPLYEGQALFGDIQQTLRQSGFRPCEIFNRTYMNTAPYCQELQGRGFLTFGEALFLRDAGWDRNDDMTPATLVQALKLAAVAVAFDQIDFAIAICRRLEQRNSNVLTALADLTGVKYLALLRDLLRAAETIEKQTGGPGSEAGSAASRTVNAIKLARYLLRAALHKALRQGSAKHFIVRDSEISEILYRYGLKDVAVRHALRLDHLQHLYERVWDGLARTS